MISFEQIGELFFKCKKAKFPGVLWREGLITYIDNDNTNRKLENIKLSALGNSLLNDNEFKNIKSSDDFVNDYYKKFHKNNLGISKTTFSPKNKIATKLNKFMLQYNASKEDILLAVDKYHNYCRNEFGSLQYSLDAQYFIEKDGGSLLLDFINNTEEDCTGCFEDTVVYDED